MEGVKRAPSKPRSAIPRSRKAKSPKSPKPEVEPVNPGQLPIKPEAEPMDELENLSRAGACGRRGTGSNGGSLKRLRTPQPQVEGRDGHRKKRSQRVLDWHSTDWRLL